MLLCCPITYINEMNSLFSLTPKASELNNQKFSYHYKGINESKQKNEIYDSPSKNWDFSYFKSVFDICTPNKLNLKLEYLKSIH